MDGGMRTAAWMGALFIGLMGLRAESLPVLSPEKGPQGLSELWDGYDPRKEALEAEVTKEWEQEVIVFRVVRYRV